MMAARRLPRAGAYAEARRAHPRHAAARRRCTAARGARSRSGRCVAAALLALLFAGYSCKLAWQSYAFHDISTGNDATPLWLPQLAMALGTVVLAIAFIDELVLELRGRRVVPVERRGASRNEVSDSRSPRC